MIHDSRILVPRVRVFNSWSHLRLLFLDTKLRQMNVEEAFDQLLRLQSQPVNTKPDPLYIELRTWFLANRRDIIKLLEGAHEHGCSAYLEVCKDATLLQTRIDTLKRKVQYEKRKRDEEVKWLRFRLDAVREFRESLSVPRSDVEEVFQKVIEKKKEEERNGKKRKEKEG
jgi:hypothetical protein